MTNLADASKVRLGTGDASRVYAGSSWAWPKQTPMLPGLVVWLDASKLNLADGAAVARFPNLGGGPQHTLIGSPAPTFRTNALNGLPVVRITNTQGKPRFTGINVHKDYTLAYVGRKWTMKIGRVISSNMSTAGVGNILWGFWDHRFECAYVDGWMIPDDIISATTQWRLYSGDTTATGTARLFSNGTLLRTHPSPPAAGGLGGTLNISGQNDTEEACDCEIAEFMLYNRKLSDAERQSVENYLRTKWNPIQSFKPTDLGTNLLGWFDGADASTIQISGSGINQWVNKGVGAMTFTQTDNAKRPTYANQTVSIVTPQVFTVTNSPATFDVVLVSKPTAASGAENNWRTLMRNDAQGGHQIILEDHATRMGTYYAGFMPAGGGFMSVMTSNTSPYTASAISEYPGGGYEAFRAFDNNPATLWHTAAPFPGWIKINFGGYPKSVVMYKIQARSPTFHSWKSWVLDGSNDDVNWVRVDTVDNEPNFSANETRTYMCDTPGAFSVFRWYVYTTWGDYVEAAALELFSSTRPTALTWDSVWGLAYGRIGDTTSMSRDGGVLIATPSCTPAGQASMHSFGGYSGGTQGWGEVKEVIFVPHNSEGHRQILEGYLAHKWGLTGLLPANHPYKTVAP